MFELTRTYTRPNTDTPWHGEIIDKTEFINRLSSVYIEPKKILSNSTSISEDGLSKTFHMLFDSEESYIQYDTDPILNTFWSARAEYNTVMGIIMGPKITNNI